MASEPLTLAQWAHAADLRADEVHLYLDRGLLYGTHLQPRLGPEGTWLGDERYSPSSDLSTT